MQLGQIELQCSPPCAAGGLLLGYREDTAIVSELMGQRDVSHV